MRLCIMYIIVPLCFVDPGIDERNILKCENWHILQAGLTVTYKQEKCRSSRERTHALKYLLDRTAHSGCWALGSKFAVKRIRRKHVSLRDTTDFFTQRKCFAGIDDG